MVTFSNPRLSAVFSDWPLGGGKRGEMTFKVEHHPKRGYRFVRQSTGKPKTDTYGGKAVIVDGDDGRTYLLQMAGMYDFVKVSDSAFMSATPEVTGIEGQAGGVFPKDARYAELKALIDSAY